MRVPSDCYKLWGKGLIGKLKNRPNLAQKKIVGVVGVRLEEKEG